METQQTLQNSLRHKSRTEKNFSVFDTLNCSNLVQYSAFHVVRFELRDSETITCVQPKYESAVTTLKHSVIADII